ncbi:MAG: UvrB/UvrC motif-containing protein [Planctomycetota bacterium]|jgi:protein arginine kinase activator
MRCQKCKKRHATVHLTEIHEGEKREAHLCEECARGSGVGLTFSFSVSDILGNLMEGKGKKGTKGGKNLRCTECGMTYSEFKKKARMGCANDYDVFSDGIAPLLEKIHGATQHIGKTPTTADTQVRKENELVRLKRDLAGLIKSEKFEKAAEVRDRIRILETELDSTG